MPNFGTHLSGPIVQTTRLKNQGERAWFKDLPVAVNDPDNVHLFVDFVKVSDYTLGDYTLSSSGTGGLASVNSSATYVTSSLGSSACSVNGMLQLQTGSTAGNFVTLQAKDLAWQLDRQNTIPNRLNIQDSKSLWYEASFSADVSATDVDVFVGLSEIAVSVVGSAAASNNYIGFKISNGAATVKYTSSTGGSAASGNASVGSGNSVTHVQGTLTKVGFVFNANNVDFYINRNYVASLQANLPTCPLSPTVEVVTNAAAGVNRTLALDYYYVCKTR